MRRHLGLSQILPMVAWSTGARRRQSACIAANGDMAASTRLCLFVAVPHTDFLFSSNATTSRSAHPAERRHQLAAFLDSSSWPAVGTCGGCTLEQAAPPDHRRAAGLRGWRGGSWSLTLLRSRTSPYVPVGLLDDDPAKQRFRSWASPCWEAHDLRRRACQDGATALLIAVPPLRHTSSESRLPTWRRRKDGRRELPAGRGLFNQPVTDSDIRDLTEEDLLGRHQIETTSRRSLAISPAGRSWSPAPAEHRQRALPPAPAVRSRRADDARPRRVALHQVQLSIFGRAMLDSPTRSWPTSATSRALERSSREHRPSRLPRGRAQASATAGAVPGRGDKSNVIGTLNVLGCAVADGRGVRQHLHRQGRRPHQRARATRSGSPSA